MVLSMCTGSQHPQGTVPEMMETRLCPSWHLNGACLEHQDWPWPTAQDCCLALVSGPLQMYSLNRVWGNGGAFTHPEGD